MKYFYAEKWADKFNTYNIQGVNGKELGTIVLMKKVQIQKFH